MIERSRRHALVALLVGAVVALGGCSDDAAEPKPLPSSSSSKAASPSPSAPTLPPEAQGTSAASAEAFVRHWIDVLNFDARDGQSEDLRSISSEQCAACTAIIDFVDRVDGRGGQIEGKGWEVMRVHLRDDQGSTAVVDAVVQVHPQTVVPTRSAKPQTYPGGRRHKVFTITNDADSWRVIRLDQPE